jgi:phosphopantothenoylcysteine synthetase/decarboxylase
VGFALEDRAIRRNAEKKLRDKGLDMIVANTPEAIGADHSALHVKTPTGPWVELPAASKATNARRIIRLIDAL